MKRIIALLLAVMLLTTLVAGCGNNNSTTDGSVTPPASNQADNNGSGGEDATVDSGDIAVSSGELSGSVSFLSYGRDENVLNATISAFNARYPDVTVNIIPQEDDIDMQLSTLAASDNMPDLFYHYNLASYAMNGWLAPLDSFMENDADLAYAVPAAMDSCVFYDKHYALPYYLQFHCLFVNTDLLAANNYELPNYDWSVSEFEALLKRFTTDKLSGINHVWGLEYDLVGVFDPSRGYLSYDMEDRTFDFTGKAYSDAMAYVRKWKVAGYVSDDLVDMAATKEGFANAYEEKFGVDVPAIDSGFVAMGNIGFWDWSGWVRSLPFEKDIIPIPHADGGEVALPMETDYVSVSASSKNKELAYLLGKFISLDPEGLKATYAAIDALPIEQQNLIAPASYHPEVLTAFNAVRTYPEGAKWMLENIDKAFCGDPSKRIPDWGYVMWDVVYPQEEKVWLGELNMQDVAQELTDRGNQALQEVFANADEAMARVQADYEANK